VNKQGGNRLAEMPWRGAVGGGSSDRFASSSSVNLEAGGMVKRQNEKGVQASTGGLGKKAGAANGHGEGLYRGGVGRAFFDLSARLERTPPSTNNRVPRKVPHVGRGERGVARNGRVIPSVYPQEKQRLPLVTEGSVKGEAPGRAPKPTPLALSCLRGKRRKHETSKSSSGKGGRKGTNNGAKKGEGVFSPVFNP